MNRAELLPEGETVEQHNQWRREEEEIVQQDRNNTNSKLGGLFKGCFRKPERPLRAIHDQEDGVDRCPMCTWELEDGTCGQCGLQFDDNGMLAFGGGPGGWSDMDEASELDMSSEDIDGSFDIPDEELELDDYDYGAYEDWHDRYPGDEQSFAVRRWLANGGPRGQPPFVMPRRRAAHSAAGSRRRSYTASITSGFTEETEMGVLEEEDEEDLEDEDSSMNDVESEDGSRETTPVVAPQPQSSQRLSRRNRPVIESETSSVTETTEEATSQSTQSIEEDDEEGGPIPNGRRRQRIQARVLSRANGTPRTAPSTASTETSNNELDEDTQYLLYQQGWSPLEHDGPEDTMDEDEDDSDGARTIAGWEPTANSNDRSRMGYSLTPVADRSTGYSQQRSRFSSSQIIDGSRGLRRRSSVLSTVSTANYEDGEADDDDSDADQAGAIHSNVPPALRSRGSRIRLPSANQSTGQPGLQANVSREVANIEDDEDSDVSGFPTRRRQSVRSRQQEYDPRISWMLRRHMDEMRELQTPNGAAPLDYLEQLRSTTPLARPRTSNRNRPSIQNSSTSPFSPVVSTSVPAVPPTEVPPRPRGPSLDRSSNNVEGLSRPPFSSGRLGQIQNIVSPAAGDETLRSGVSSNLNNGNIIPASPTFSPQSAIHATHSSTTSASQPQSTGNGINDVIQRPVSRVSSRPPSAAGRRSSAGLVPGYQGMTPGVGIGYAQRNWQNQNRNPFIPQNIVNVRPRPSINRLTEQPSNATLRPRNSQRLLRQPSHASVRENGAQTPVMRSSASRNALRQQASQHRLQGQPSRRDMRSYEASHIGQSPVAIGPNGSPVAARTSGVAGSRFTEDERSLRVAELIRNRSSALGTNPFTSRTRRVGIHQTTRDLPTTVDHPQHYRFSNPGMSPVTDETHTPIRGAVQPSQSLSNNQNTIPSAIQRRQPRGLGSPLENYVAPEVY